MAESLRVSASQALFHPHLPLHACPTKPPSTTKAPPRHALNRVISRMSLDTFIPSTSPQRPLLSNRTIILMLVPSSSRLKIGPPLCPLPSKTPFNPFPIFLHLTPSLNPSASPLPSAATVRVPPISQPLSSHPSVPRSPTTPLAPPITTDPTSRARRAGRLRLNGTKRVEHEDGGASGGKWERK